LGYSQQHSQYGALGVAEDSALHPFFGERNSAASSRSVFEFGAIMPIDDPGDFFQKDWQRMAM
jgi:hypothetical protein